MAAIGPNLGSFFLFRITVMVQKFIIGKKGTSSQVFTDDGVRVPTTQVHTNPCYVVDIKTQSKDGYWAIKLGFGETRNIKKPQSGMIKKAGIKTPLRFFKEIRLDTFNQTLELAETEGKKKGIKLGELELHVGDTVNPESLFTKGDKVQVTGVSKGKGFQGVVKRHGFAGGPRTHGQSDRERAPGSIGQSATPGRVYKGKKMAGRMGTDTVTVMNLEILDVTNDGLTIRGLVPGVKEGLLVIKSGDAIPEPKEEPVEEPEKQEEPVKKEEAAKEDKKEEKEVTEEKK